MILVYILLTLIAGAFLSALSGLINKNLPRIISLFCQIAAFILASTFYSKINNFSFAHSDYDIFIPWIGVIGANIHLSIDGLSLIFILFTLFLGIIGTLVENKSIAQGFYHFHFLLLITGITGIFISAYLLLFFFFWELMLVPMYFLMVKFKNLKDDNNHAPFKFLLYTQLSGLFMLISILALYFMQGRMSGIYSFDLRDLLQNSIPAPYAIPIMLGFIAAFVVKLGIIPFHGWMPTAITASPIGVILTGILIKTGAYGIFRFSIPLFHEPSVLFASTAMALGIVTIFYGGFIAFSSTDIRKIAVYSSISHTGFILVGLYAFHILAWQGVVYQMIASALGVGGMLILAEMLYSRTQTYDINQLSGLWSKTPNLSGMGLFISLTLLGLPGLANFIAEFLILAGTFQQSVGITILASLGVVLAAAYSLRIVQKIFVGHYQGPSEIKDLSWKEKGILALLVGVLLCFGLNTKPITQTVEKSLQKIIIIESDNPDVNPSDKDNALVFLNHKNE